MKAMPLLIDLTNRLKEAQKVIQERFRSKFKAFIFSTVTGANIFALKLACRAKVESMDGKLVLKTYSFL
jgi:hypothetical protein